MSIEANYSLGAIAIGIGASLVMDLWNLFLKRTFNIPSLIYCFLPNNGRKRSPVDPQEGQGRRYESE